MNIIKLLELARFTLAGIGYYLAYQPGITLEHSFNYLLLLVVIPLAGLTGLESVCFSDLTAQSKGREIGSAYQVQSGINNLAIAITAFMVWFWQWGLFASLTIIMVLLTFFALSSINHTVEYVTARERKAIHLMRPVLTLMIIAATIPLIYNLLSIR